MPADQPALTTPPPLEALFPRLKFSQSNGLWKQIQHTDSEISEVITAFYEPDPEQIALEYADVMQSAATGLYILQRDHGINPDEILEKTRRKNQKRGYEEII